MKTHPPAHPTRLELGALTAGALADERAAEIREHLADCPECLEKIGQMFSLPESAPSPELEVSAEEMREARQRLHAALAAEEAPAAVVLPFQPFPGGAAEPARPRGRRIPAWLAAAASLLAAGGLVYFLAPTGDRGDRPKVAVSTLLPVDFAVRGPEDRRNDIDCPSQDGTFRWLLTFTRNPPGSSTAAVSLRTGEGRELLSLQAPIDTAGKVEASFPFAAIPDGKLKAVVAATGADGAKVEQEFEVVVACR